MLGELLRNGEVGFELSHDPVTPIMFYSGAGFLTDIEMGLEAGAQAYLVKPDFDNLKPTIDRLIAEAGSRASVVN